MKNEDELLSECEKFATAVDELTSYWRLKVMAFNSI